MSINSPFIPISSSLSVQPDRTRRIRSSFLISTSLTLVLLSAGLGSFFLFWLTSWHGGTSFQDAISQGAFFINEGNKTHYDGTQTARLVGLTITTVTTHIVSASAPFLVGLSAYCTVSLWLTGQSGLDEPLSGDVDKLPTPLQYGLIFTLATSAGVKAICDSSQYLWRNTRTSTSVPTIVFVAFAFTVVVYLTTHLVILADFWLHATTSAAAVKLATSINTPAPEFGVAFNNSLCTLAAAGCIFPGLTFDMEPADTIPDTIQTMIQTGRNIMSNSTNPKEDFSVILLHNYDDLAVVVPTPVKGSASWTAPSFGIRAKCRNITPEANLIFFGDPGDVVLVNATWTNLSSTGPIGFQGPSGINNDPGLFMAVADIGAGPRLLSNITPSDPPHPISYPSDPPTMVVQFAWEALIISDLPNTFITVGYYEWSLQTFSVISAFTECTMDFLNLTLRWDPSQQGGRYSLKGVPIRNEGPFVTTMWSLLLTQPVMRDLQIDLTFVAQTERNEANLMAAVSQSISRAAASMFAGAVFAIPVDSLFVEETILMGRYPVAPVLTYAGTLFLYSAIALAVFFWAISIKTQVIRMPGKGGKETTALELAHVQITDPLMVITQSFEYDEDGEDLTPLQPPINSRESDVGAATSTTSMVELEPVMTRTSLSMENMVEMGVKEMTNDTRSLTDEYVRLKPSIATDGLDLFEERENTKKLFFALGETGLRFRVRDKLGADEI
ncbi:hypothetical protein BDN72DRAFT_850597 [Pluteus cervinus]|uniref:Uncharacterized protein n=1 Tax=Pluteus cervinus TaxID=181527 RepID=A0ACD3A427_9AGAR|nr:hypothetical protein BDN72DRAFT_850597 [Pluteus cervinus]